MNNPVNWRDFWEENAAKNWSDYEYDHGKVQEQEIEDLSKRELLTFIDPRPADIILDVGCGTGSNELLMHSRVKRVIGIDCIAGALERCQKRIEAEKIENVELIHGDATHIPAPDHTVDKVLCISVFQYLNDTEVRTALKEFIRVLKSDGMLILHVKNRSSLYLSTLCAAKKLKMLLSKRTKSEHIRPYRWYMTELREAGFEVLAYNSFNIVMIELIPIKWRLLLQKWELKGHNKFPLRLGFLRRRGADLKIKARAATR